MYADYQKLAKKIDDKTYITIHGNLYVGKDGGIIGDNFPKHIAFEATRDAKDEPTTIPLDEVYHTVKRSHFCVNCFFEHIKKLREDLIKENLTKIRDLECKIGIQLQTEEAADGSTG